MWIKLAQMVFLMFVAAALAPVSMMLLAVRGLFPAFTVKILGTTYDFAPQIAKRGSAPLGDLNRAVQLSNSMQVSTAGMVAVGVIVTGVSVGSILPPLTPTMTAAHPFVARVPLA